jgi:hypothetical protein
MTRVSIQQGVSQRQRTVDNPLFLGTFSETSLRYLQGTLEATYRVQQDGFGGGTYNHWFGVEITSPAWIILRKDGERSKYVQLSFYDLDLIPIEGRSIFDADSVRGDLFIFLEDLDGSLIALEDGLDTTNTTTIGPILTVNQTINTGFNAFTEELAQINAGVTITIDEGSTWLIGFVPDPSMEPENLFLLDPSDSFDFNSTHEHSRNEWVEAWEREHQQTDRYPAVFEPLTTRP